MIDRFMTHTEFVPMLPTARNPETGYPVSSLPDIGYPVNSNGDTRILTASQGPVFSANKENMDTSHSSVSLTASRQTVT